MNLRSQLLISDVLRVHNTLECVYENMGIVSVVITPFKFFYVAVHVFDAHLVKRISDRTLKQAPYAFNVVCVNITHNPFLFKVTDSFVASIVVGNSYVRLQFIRVDSLSLIFHGSFYEIMQGFFLNVLDSFNTNFPATLDRTRNPGFIAFVAVALAFRLATYQGFVNFYHTDKGRAFKGVFTHRLADTMAEIPGCLVRDSEGPLYLISRDSFLRFAHKIDGDKPFMQRQVGIVHDSSAHNGELVPATSAFPAIVLGKFKYIQVAAASTMNADRPADLLKHFAAFIIGLKLIHQRYEVRHGSESS